MEITKKYNEFIKSINEDISHEEIENDSGEENIGGLDLLLNGKITNKWK